MASFEFSDTTGQCELWIDGQPTSPALPLGRLNARFKARRSMR
jgi:hypothetical protein